MNTATRLATLLLSSAAVLACSDDEKATPPPVDYESLLKPPDTAVDAGGAPRPAINLEGWPAIDPGAAKPKAVTQAVAILKPTGDINTNKAGGSVRFSATNEGARVKADLTDLSYLTKYVLRVHVFGDCSSDGAAAGGGYNFGGSSLEQPDPKFIMGYLSDLTVDIGGTAKGEQSVRGAALQGGYSIVGRSVVLHVKPTDASSDGQRVACGVIGVAGDGDAR